MTETTQIIMTRKLGRPPKYQTEEERLRAQAERMRIRRGGKLGGPVRPVGRPPKYKTAEERKTVKSSRAAAWHQKQVEAEQVASLAAFIERWGDDVIPMMWPLMYKDGRGKLPAAEENRLWAAYELKHLTPKALGT